MITAQDINEKGFHTGFNGYVKGEVDEFLDQIAADLTELSKENAALKSKMRVLVEKVEEYRQTEDSMRLALMSAQKMGSQIEVDAQKKADSIIAQARETAERLNRRATDGIANEEAKLEEAKKATAKFFDHMRAVCEKQMEFYDKLSRMRLVGEEEVQPAAAPAEEKAPEEKPVEVTEEEETVRSIETSAVSAALEESAAPMTVDTEIPAEEEEPTRRFGEEVPRKKRGFDDFRFDDI
ncbi:MAG: DivIVA domain-containing protein [Oscillospiraceae bacterium]